MPRSTGSNLLTYRVHSANVPSSVKACSKEARGIRNTVPRNHVISQIPELHSSGNHLLVLAKGNFPTRRSVAVIIQGQRTSKPSAYLNVLIISCLLRFYRDKCTRWPRLVESTEAQVPVSHSFILSLVATRAENCLLVIRRC